MAAFTVICITTIAMLVCVLCDVFTKTFTKTQGWFEFFTFVSAMCAAVLTGGNFVYVLVTGVWGARIGVMLGSYIYKEK